MAKSVNKKVKGVDSIVQYHARDQIWSLTIEGKTDLVDLEIGTGKNNDVSIKPQSDFRKENTIDVRTSGTGTPLLTITHGENGTENHSVLTANRDTEFYNAFQAYVTATNTRLATLEERVGV